MLFRSAFAVRVKESARVCRELSAEIPGGEKCKILGESYTNIFLFTGKSAKNMRKLRIPFLRKQHSPDCRSGIFRITKIASVAWLVRLLPLPQSTQSAKLNNDALRTYCVPVSSSGISKPRCFCGRPPKAVRNTAFETELKADFKADPEAQNDLTGVRYRNQTSTWRKIRAIMQLSSSPSAEAQCFCGQPEHAVLKAAFEGFQRGF